MPAKADTRLKVLFGGRQRLPVIAKSQLEVNVAMHMPAVLDKTAYKPLRQVVAVDAKIDRLLIVQHIVQRQLIERQLVTYRVGRFESECAKRQRTGLITRSA